MENTSKAVRMLNMEALPRAFKLEPVICFLQVTWKAAHRENTVMIMPMTRSA